jgi:hypothetical protein
VTCGGDVWQPANAANAAADSASGQGRRGLR